VSGPGSVSSERRYVVSLVVSIAAGVAIRVYLAFAAQGKSWSDSAIIALMAMHELRGKFYAFYWGQSYMGSIESLGVAPFFALFGVSDVALSMGLLPWYVLFAIALYGVTRHCGGPLAGAICAWLLAFAPPYVQYQQIMPRGDYPETLAFGTLLLWLTLRVTHGALAAPAIRRHLLTIAFVAGLAFWTNWLAFPYFAVVAIYLLLHDPKLPLRSVAFSMLAFFFLGSLPFWVYNLREGFPTFSFVADVQSAESRRVALQYALRGAIPELLGFRDLNGQFAFGWPGRLLTAIAAVAAVALLFGLWRSWLALLRGRLRETHPMIALLLLGVAMVAIYSVGLPGRFHVPRYLLPLVTSTFALGGLAIAWLARRSQVLATATLLGLLAFYGVQIVELHDGFLSSKERPGVEGPVDRLVDYLVRAGIRHGYADYGDATIATYLARERVVLTDYNGARYPLEEVDFRDPAIIVRDGTPAADETLAALDAKFSVRQIPGYRIYWPIDYDGVGRAPLPRRGWSVSATPFPADAGRAVDGDRWTYWSAPANGEPAVFTVDLGAEQTVSGVFFDVGDRGSDAFVRLRIEASGDGARWTLVKDAAWGLPVYFEPNGQVTTVPRNTQTVLFPPRTARALRLTILENRFDFNWSIGELAVLGPAKATAALRLPEFADPMSPSLLERRLRSQIEREPQTNAPLVELRRLYQSLGETDKLSEIVRIEAERFRPQQRLDWRFGRDLTLLGIDWHVPGSRRLEITYYWQARRTMDTDYAAYLHLRREGSQLQDDYLPGAPHTTRAWHAGEIVRETRLITVPQDAADGSYSAEVGLWVPGNQRHVRLGTFAWWGPRTRTLLELEVHAEGLTVTRIGS
jgi:hypothetical protein